MKYFKDCTREDFATDPSKINLDLFYKFCEEQAKEPYILQFRGQEMLEEMIKEQFEKVKLEPEKSILWHMMNVTQAEVTRFPPFFGDW